MAWVPMVDSGLDIEGMERAQNLLDGAAVKLLALPPLLLSASADTSLACGEALGVLHRAMDLLARDIEEAKRLRSC